jgi:serine O-acetyltransferase
MLLIYRISHLIWHLHLYTLARLISNLNRFLFKIDIHPEAKIANTVKFPSKYGIVIGSSAVIKDYCVIHQNVTLGNNGKDLGSKRHPTVEENVIIYPNAKLLGPIVVGHHTIVEAGCVYNRNIESYSYVKNIKEIYHFNKNSY